MDPLIHQEQEQVQEDEPRLSSFTMQSPFSLPQQQLVVAQPHHEQMRRSSLPSFVGCLASPNGNSNKRRATKRSSFSSRRRSSLSFASPGNRRGHSDMALEISSGSAGLSHLTPGRNSKKRLRRSISWDVRPPKVHELKRSTAKPNALNNNSTGERCDGEEGTETGGQNESWYSKEEYSNIIKEQMKNIMIMRYLRENGTDDRELDPDLYCERGLESYQSKERRREIDMKRKMHQFLVIREQARQSLAGTKDPELLRVMASTQSELSRLKAQFRAAVDQHEAINPNGRPLSEEEKLLVGLEQHQKMIQEKYQQSLDQMDVSLSVQQQELQNHETPQSESDPTNGIISLASLWAHEGNGFSGDVDAKWTKNDTTFGQNGSNIFSRHAAMQHSPKQLAELSGRKSVSSEYNKQDMPLVGFGGLHPPPFTSKPPAPVQSPQAIHNAFCSTYAHSSDFSYSSSRPKHVKKSPQSNHSSSTMSSVMPTAAFASLHIHPQQQDQHHPPPMIGHPNNMVDYSSMLSQFPK